MIQAEGEHPAPSRTRQLSPPAPMVLGAHAPGRVGHCQGSLFFFPLTLCQPRRPYCQCPFTALVLLALLSVVLLGAAFSHHLAQPVFTRYRRPRRFPPRCRVSTTERRAIPPIAGPARWQGYCFPTAGTRHGRSPSGPTPRGPKEQPQPAVSVLGQPPTRWAASSPSRASATTPSNTPRRRMARPISTLTLQTQTFSPPGDPRNLGLLVNSVALRPGGALPRRLSLPSSCCALFLGSRWSS